MSAAPDVFTEPVAIDTAAFWARIFSLFHDYSPPQSSLGWRLSYLIPPAIIVGIYLDSYSDNVQKKHDSY